jgi:hypothetical protein
MNSSYKSGFPPLARVVVPWNSAIVVISTKLTMGRIYRLLALASFGQFFVAVQGTDAAIQVSGTPPANASAPLLEAFVSYSIEFSSFPDFAGTQPDTI